jgi:hypothetical protein
MLDEFKKFIMRGNVVDLAVGRARSNVALSVRYRSIGSGEIDQNIGLLVRIRLALEQGLERPLHVPKVEGLGQQDWICKSLSLIKAAIPGGKGNGNAKRLKRPSNGIASIVAEVDIKNSAVQLAAIGEHESIRNRMGRSNDLATELG